MIKNRETRMIKEIIDSIDVGIFIIDPDTHIIVEANSYLSEITGRSSNEIVGNVCHRFICSAMKGKCPITDLGKNMSKDECNILDIKGTEIPVFKTVKNVFVNNKEYLLESFVDIRDLKESQDLLLKAYNSITKMEYKEHSLREYKKVMDSTDDFIIILDHDYRMIMVNDAFARERKEVQSEIIGQTVVDILGVNTFNATRKYIDAALKGKTTEFEMPYTYQFSDLGKKARFLVKFSPIYDDLDNIESVLVILKDITRIVTAVESKKRIFNMSKDIIAISNYNGNIIELNSAWQIVLGWQLKDAINKKWLDYVHPDDHDQAASMNNWLKTGKDIEGLEIRYLTASGVYKWVSWNASADYDHQEIYLIGRDVTSKKKSEDELYKIAMTDFLTGISNRRHFIERFKTEIERCIRYNRQLSYLTFDIDDFKLVNDQYGHDVGDETIISITKIGSSICRESDEFGRLGGEEFGILLPEISKNEAANFADRLLKYVENKLFDIAGNQFRITISIGLTEYIQNDSVGSMMKRADKALYSSKDLGKNRATIY